MSDCWSICLRDCLIPLRATSQLESLRQSPRQIVQLSKKCEQGLSINNTLVILCSHLLQIEQIVVHILYHKALSFLLHVGLCAFPMHLIYCLKFVCSIRFKVSIHSVHLSNVKLTKLCHMQISYDFKPLSLSHFG